MTTTAPFLAVIMFGTLYGILAAALMAAHRASGVVNLAFGEQAIFAVTVYSVCATMLTPAISILASVVATSVFALAFDAVLVRPFGDVRDSSGARHRAALVTSLGASIAISSALALVAGAYPRRVPLFSPCGPGSAQFQLLATVVVACFVGIALHRPEGGRLLLAVGGSPTLAAASKMPVARIRAVAIAATGAVTALGAIALYAQIGAVSPFGGPSVMFRALAVMIGAGSLRMSRLWAAGIALAGVESLAGTVSPDWRDMSPYLALIVLIGYRSLTTHERRV